MRRSRAGIWIAAAAAVAALSGCAGGVGIAATQIARHLGAVHAGHGEVGDQQPSAGREHPRRLTHRRAGLLREMQHVMQDRDIRRGMDGAGMYCEGVKGECNLGQQEIAFR